MKTEKVIYNFEDEEGQYMRVDKLGRRMYDVSEDIKETFYHEYPGLAPEIDIFDNEPFRRFSCALDECGGDVEEAISMAFGRDSAKDAIAFEIYDTNDEYLRTDYHAIDWVLATKLDYDKAIKLAQSRDEHPERGEIKWNPQSRWLYRGDAQNGLRERWFANGQIYDRANLKNGLFDGIYERWNLSGSRDFIEEYSKGESVAQYFWENSENSWGDLRAIADYVLVNDRIDLLNGVKEKYYGNGQIKERYNLVDGVKEGLWEKWWPNGQLLMQCNRQNGSSEGLSQIWDENGNLAFLSMYTNKEQIALKDFTDNKESFGDQSLFDEVLLKYDEKGRLKQEEPKAKKNGLKI